MTELGHQLGSVPVLLLGLTSFACLYLAAVGGIVSERAGVSALALDGMLVAGALAGSWAALRYGAAEGLAIGAGTGLVVAALLALLIVVLRVNQLVAAVTVNLVAYAAAAYAGDVLLGRSSVARALPRLPGIALRPTGVHQLAHSSVSPLVAIALAAGIVVAWTLSRTRVGLRLRAVGEDVRAARRLGVHARWYGFAATLTAGLLAGLGGAGLAIEAAGRAGAAPAIGRGYLALAALLIARRSLSGTLFWCLLLGWLDAVAVGRLGTGPWSTTAGVVPWVVALVLLAVAASPVRGPRELRRVYDAGTG